MNKLKCEHVASDTLKEAHIKLSDWLGEKAWPSGSVRSRPPLDLVLDLDTVQDKRRFNILTPPLLLSLS